MAATTATKRRKPASPESECRVTAYARDVVEGRIVAGELVRLACQRHLDDLREGAARGLRWNQAEADRAIDIFSHLRQWKGRWKGQPLELLPWQQFRIGSVFGWQMWSDDHGCWVRRFTEAYTEVARKNGKSTEAAGVGIILLDFDDEAGAEVYAAATKRDQARRVWDEAERIVAQSPALSRRIKHVRSSTRLFVPETGSYFTPLGRDSDSEHGLNPHAALIDELHVARSRDLVDALETAFGARVQPLIWYITTAGVEGESIYTETSDRARRVVRGIERNDRMFVYIATLDEGDDWTDPTVYIKANPSLGHTVQMSDLIAERDKAVKTPGRRNAFLRLRLNLRTGQESAWIDVKQFDRGQVDRLEREGDRVIGVDLGGTRDLSAAAAVTLDEDLGLDVEWRFWMPADRVIEATDRDQVPYQQWIDDGWIEATDGDYRDDLGITHDVYEFGSETAAAEVAIDPWQKGVLSSGLIDLGVEVVEVPQTFRELAAATDVIEQAIGRGALNHTGNPVARWMFANCSVDEHPEGFRKPSKRQAKRNRTRIDGVAALVTAVARLLRMRGEGNDEEPPAFLWVSGEGDE
jgi:phage terminase large subunit-like protein